MDTLMIAFNIGGNFHDNSNLHFENRGSTFYYWYPKPYDLHCTNNVIRLNQ